MWEMHDGWGWWMIMGWVWMIAFWGLIIWAVVVIVGRTGGRTERPAPTPLDIIERRYASGELTHEEFERMRRQLSERKS